jgi:putative hemolysin
VRLESLAEEGKQGARVALALVKDPTRFLSTVQIGITLIGILSGAFGGAALGGDVSERLATVEALRAYSHALGFGLVVGLTTYLSLVVGELVPKRLGLQNPERIAVLVAPTMQTLSRLVAPLVTLLSFSSEVLLRLLGVKNAAEPSLTENEIIAIVHQGTNLGVIEKAEQEMVEGIFRLDEQIVASVMTPRPDIDWLDVNDSRDDILETIREHVYSYYPVCREEIDNVVGVVKSKDLLERALKNEPLDLSAIMRPPQYVPENVPVSRVLETFKKSGVHVALVVGEHGGIEGMLTLYDILEEIVGDIDQEDPEIVQREDGSWLLDGAMAISKLEDFFSHLVLPEDEEGDYLTVAGFIMNRLGQVPKLADHFEFSGYRFEVVDMDGRRIDKVLVQNIKAEVAPSQDESEA